MIDDGKAHQIIIIKRGNEEEEAHHGGAWKIAFADFMTAMMALFLVLWLINAANEETKRSVASYFNPVKLVDRNRSSKGINDQKGGPTSEAESGNDGQASKTSKDNPTTNSLTADISRDAGVAGDAALEAAFFAAPLAAIETIKSVGIISSADVEVLNKESRTNSGGDFADPFMPSSSGKGEASDVATGKAVGKAKTVEDDKTSAGAVASGDGEAGEKRPDVAEQNEIGLGANEADQVIDTQRRELAAKELKAAIYDALKSETDSAKQLEASIDVKATDTGVLITVSDTVKDPMFEIGSAVPAPAMVLAVEAISKTLLARKGGVHIFGHTDGRQFRGEDDGNWRLSTQRAKATYFILLHGGLPDRRIQEIAGHADRQLRNIADPLSGENRRIEILLGTL